MVPPTPDLEKLLANYKSTVAVAHGEVFDPTPANIESRVKRSALPNGMKMVMLPKKTEGDMVTAVIELRFGDENSLKGKNAAAQFAAALISRGGTTEHTRQQLQEEMRKLDANIAISGGGGGGGRGGRGGRGGGGGAGNASSANANITAPAKNFEAALRLAVEMLKDPAYPENEFEQMRAQRVKALQNPRTEPTQLAAETLQRHLSPYAKGDVLYSPTREEEIAELQAVTLADIKSFHDRFYGANFGVFAVVGPVDPAQVHSALTGLLGNWNTRAAYKRIESRFGETARSTRKSRRPTRPTRSSRRAFVSGCRIRTPITRRCCLQDICSAVRLRRVFPIASAIGKD